MNLNKIVNKIANYRSDTWLVMVGDYGCISLFTKVIDAIHINGRGGHSFSVKINDGSKDIMTAGSFDGDGAAYINWICSGVEGNKLHFDKISNLIPENSDVVINTGNGDSILVVKGTQEGILSIQKIVDNVLNCADYSDTYLKILTDDKPEIQCGTLYIDEWENSFGFYCVLDKETFFDKPLKIIEKINADLNFYRS